MSYFNATEHNLEHVYDVEWRDAAWEFDLTGIWRHGATGTVYFADDSGCSCPSPFEDVRGLDDLTEAPRAQVLIDHLAERRESLSSYDNGESNLTRVDREIAAAVRAAFM